MDLSIVNPLEESIEKSVTSLLGEVDRNLNTLVKMAMLNSPP